MLVVAEVALASALLIGAGLMLRSFVNLMRTDPGFRPEHVLTASVSLPAADYKDGEAIARFYDLLVMDLSRLPGVQAAGAGTDIPWTGYNENTSFDIEGRSHDANALFHARYHAATPDYFRALGIPLAGGRFLTERDNAAAPQVILINRSLARKYWPNEDAVGKRVSFNDPPDWVTVAGVVGDVKDAPTGSEAEPAFWWPELQQQPARTMSIAVRANAVRANSDPKALLEAVQQDVRRLNPSLAVADVRMMDQIANSSVATPRFSLFLVGLFACLALALAAIGMYGVVAYSVSQRTHEFGLRMALGAKPWDVQRLVLMHGTQLALAGVALGAVCALLLARVVRSLLFGVSAEDPATFAVVSAIAIAVAVLACYVPARRATQADPMTALRCE
jgi:predicted permease